VIKSCLRSATLAVAVALVGTGAAMAEETEPKLSHPADPVEIPTDAGSKSAFDLAVPFLDRPAAHPSYGPTPTEGAADPVTEMDQMMEMDHSAHQMPGMDMNNMPGMNHDNMPETTQ
jgi:hypothetical protein